MRNINNKKQTTFINGCVEDPYTPSPRCLRTRPSPSRERGKKKEGIRSTHLRERGNKLSPSPVGEKVREAGMRGKGFTLIELLVVVLIIGILAAVAVPQYQQAVFKTKFNKVWSIVQQLKQMEELYFLENGKYKDNLVDSYVDFSKSCVGGGANFICEGGFMLDINAGNISLWYSPLVTPGMNQSQVMSAMDQTPDKRFVACQYFAHHDDYPNQVRCCGGVNASIANCKKVLITLGIPYVD